MRTLPFLTLFGVLALGSLASCSAGKVIDDVDEECVPECGEQICGREATCGRSCGTCPIGLACSADGLSCLAPPAVGEACLDDGDCGTGRFCLQPTEGAPGGYCTQLCSAENPCPDESVCSVGPGGESVCHAACEPEGGTGCRVAEGYVCTDDGVCPTCVPSCDGRFCGGDGCGGWCGTCPADNRYLACDGGGCAQVFTSVGELPQARWGVGAAVLDGLVYLIGGERAREMAGGLVFGESVDWVSRFNPETRETVPLDDFALPDPLAAPHVFAAKGPGQDRDRLFILGGVTKTREQLEDPETKEKYIVDTFEPSRSFYELASGEGLSPEWSERQALPESEASIGSAAVELNGSLYFFAGETKNGLSTSGFRYDLPTDPVRRWSPISSARTPRHSMTAATDGRYIWLFGGWDGRVDLKLIERYDPVNDTWTTVGELPFGVSRATALTIEDRIFLFGGAGSALVPLVVFDPVRETAHQIGTMYDRLLDQAPVATRSGVFLFGGMRLAARQPAPTREILRFTVPKP